MGLVPFRGFEIHDTASRVRDVLPQWRPRNLSTREGYLKSLHAFLEKSLAGPPLYVNKDLENFKADLVVAEEVVVRIQTGLTTEKMYKDAVEYLKNFKYWKGVMLMILVGEVKEKFAGRLDDFINQINNDLEFMSNQAIVIIRR